MKTKVITMMILFLGSVNLSIAQKAEAKDLTLEATLNLQVGGAPISFNVSEIRMRYFLTSKDAIRVKVAYEMTSGTNYVYSPMDPTLIPFTLKYSSSKLNLGIGYEHHFKGTEKLSPYFGGEAGFGISTLKTEGINTFNGIELSEGSTFTSQNTGAYNVYAGLVFGADYYIVPHLYVGAELAYGFGYSNFGNREVYNSNTATTIVNTLGTGIGFGLQANPGIRIGLKF